MQQKVHYDFKPIFCSDCKGIGHTDVECRQKRYEVAQKKIKPKKVWVPKAQVGNPARSNGVQKESGQVVQQKKGKSPLATISEEQYREEITEVPILLKM